MRKKSTLTKLAPAAIAAWTLAAAAAFATGDEKEVELDYRRRAAAERRPASSRVSTSLQPSLPSELRISVDARRDEVAVPRRAPRREGAPPPEVDRDEPDWSRLAREARRAGSETAHERVEHEGRRQVYHAGFYDGLRHAMNDPALGEWDRRDGFERGLRDREAYRVGDAIGAESAERTATATASEDVAAAFYDLSREPRFAPRRAVPAMDARLSRARKPQLRDVFRDVPPYADAPHGFSRPDPWTYYRYSGYGDFYDRGWSDPGRAFAGWRRHNDSFWRSLIPEEKDYFRDVFLHRYEHELARFYRDVAERAYDRGYGYGFDYGATIQAEWSYRQGFREGWNEAVRGTAYEVYPREFRRFYDERYRVRFEEWSTTPRPEISEVSLADANDDGVFEPGEAIRVGYEITNYGGAPGSFTVALGGPLASAASAPVELPRRRAVRASRPLEAVIDARVPARTEQTLDLRVAGLERPLKLYVSYPLELDRRVALVAHDTLAGRAVIETTVQNTSRRPVGGWLELESAPLGRPLTRGFGPLGPGEARRVSFELTGLAPLDLLGGTVEVGLAAFSESSARGAAAGKLHDELGHRLPALALDLEERDLVLFLEQLAQGGGRSDDVRRAQELMLRRLRLDWSAVAEAGGNRYKDDLKNGTRKTALGDLVASYRDGRHNLRDREVFTALAPRIEALAKELPGAHPFLRKSMKKLARELG